MANNHDTSLPIMSHHDPFVKKRKPLVTYKNHRKRSRSARAAAVDEEMEDVMLSEEEVEDDEEEDPLLLSPMTPMLQSGMIKSYNSPTSYLSTFRTHPYFSKHSNEQYHLQNETISQDNDSTREAYQLNFFEKPRFQSQRIMPNNELRQRSNQFNLSDDDADEIDSLSWSPISTSTPLLATRSLPLGMQPLMPPLDLRDGEAKRRKLAGSNRTIHRRGASQHQDESDTGDVHEMPNLNIQHPGRQIATLKRTRTDERLEDSALSNDVMKLGSGKEDGDVPMMGDRLLRDMRGGGMAVRDTRISTPNRRVRFSLPAEETARQLLAPYPVHRRNTLIENQRPHVPIATPLASPRTPISARPVFRRSSAPLEANTTSRFQRAGTEADRSTSTISLPLHLQPLTPLQTRGRQIDAVVGRSTSWSNEVGEVSDDDMLAFGIGKVALGNALEDPAVGFGDEMVRRASRLEGVQGMERDQKEINSPSSGVVWLSPAGSSMTEDSLEYDRSSSEENTLVGESPLPPPRTTPRVRGGRKRKTHDSKRSSSDSKTRAKMMKVEKATKMRTRRVGSRSGTEPPSIKRRNDKLLRFHYPTSDTRTKVTRDMTGVAFVLPESTSGIEERDESDDDDPLA